jgi:hypothetical protein
MKTMWMLIGPQAGTFVEMDDAAAAAAHASGEAQDGQILFALYAFPCGKFLPPIRIVQDGTTIRALEPGGEAILSCFYESNGNVHADATEMQITATKYPHTVYVVTRDLRCGKILLEGPRPSRAPF